MLWRQSLSVLTLCKVGQVWKQEKKSLKVWERVWIDAFEGNSSQGHSHIVSTVSGTRERKAVFITRNILCTRCSVCVWGAKALIVLTPQWWVKCLSGLIYFFRSVSALGFSILSWRGIADTFQEQHLVVKHASAAGEWITVTEYIESKYDLWLLSVHESLTVFV